MKRYVFFLLAAIVTIFTQCDTLKTLPTNTSGGLFSLNGSWQLTTSTDNQALAGTVVQVFPGVADATIKTLGNNNYCLRERDVLWRNLKAGQGGVFSLEALVNACNGNTVYRPATLTAVNNDEIRITTQTINNTELVQTWQRARNQ
jgi:hypothetical protein